MARASKKRAGNKATGTGRGKAVEAPPAATSRGRAISAFEDLDRLFDDFLRRRWPGPAQMQWPAWRGFSHLLDDRVPTIDIVDQDSELVVRAEVPGVTKDDLDVSVVDRTLTIKGVQREEKEETKKDFYRKEIRSGEFSRSVLLPAEVDANKASASYKDGIVELHLPKATQARRRKIDLS